MSSFALKFLAIVLMTIDHVGLLLFPTHRILRAIGRLAFPIFAFQIGVGFKHTHCKEKIHIANDFIYFNIAISVYIVFKCC